MSPNISSFAGELVQMAAAMERLPQVEAQVSDLEAKLNSAQTHSQGLELNILDYKSQIEDLNAKLRSVEGERDEAMFRALELEERNEKVVQAFRTIADRVDSTLTLIVPQSAEPVVANDFQPSGDNTPSHAVELNTPQSDTEGGTQNQPSNESTAGSDNYAPIPSSAPNEEWGKTVPPAIYHDTESSKYAGKYYIDVEGYVSFEDWLAGGGSEYNYHYRRGATSNAL